MEYKVGIDRVHINDEEENFPYPLKLWSDGENIYVKVLRLPSSVDEFPRKDQAVPFSSTLEPTLLKLCIETLQTSRTHGGKCREGRYQAHKQKFQVRCYSQPVSNPVVGNTYTFSILNCMTSMQQHLAKYINDVYLTVRATLRYPDSNSSYLHYRTGVYSNISKITYTN